MNKSDNIGKLAEALSKAQAAYESVQRTEHVGYATKGGTAKNYNYAPLENIFKACRKALSDNGLAVIQPTSMGDGNLVVETILMHSSGEWISGQICLPSNEKNPQGEGSALTYARRYALSAMLGVASEEDDDAQAATGGKSKQEPKPAQKPSENGAPAATGEHICPIHKVPMKQFANKAGNQHWYSHKLDNGEWCNGTEKKQEQSTPAPAPDPEKEIFGEDKKTGPEPELAGYVNMVWLKEQLQKLQARKLKAWANATVVDKLNAITGKQAKSVTEAVGNLNKEQAEKFVREVQEATEMA